MSRKEHTGCKRLAKYPAAVGCALLLLTGGMHFLSHGAQRSADAACRAEIAVEDYGTITVALDSGAAPKTVENFISLAESGFANGLSHTRGAISMARSEDYDSASSQFFIVQEDSTYLDGSYAAFGYVTGGMDVVDAICAAARSIDGNGTIAPEAQPVIASITVTENVS